MERHPRTWGGRVRSATSLFLLILIAMLAGTVTVAQTPEVSITVSVEREITRLDDNGRQVVETEPVDAVQPGDVLVYTLRAVNRGMAPAVGARIVDPIPDGTLLLVDELAAADRPTGVSLDGGRSWQAFPARVQRVEADGTTRIVAAPAEAYTHLRWELNAPLGPGETRDVSFKVRVN